jgi:hypothetical protein
MRYVPWTDRERLILIKHDILGEPDLRLCDILLKMACTTRTLVSVRSQLHDLKKIPAWYDSKNKKWIEDEIDKQLDLLESAES